MGRSSSSSRSSYSASRSSGSYSSSYKSIPITRTVPKPSGVSTINNKSSDKKPDTNKPGVKGDISPGIWSSIKEGFGLGTGVSIANQIVGRTFDSLFGARTIKVEHVNNNTKPVEDVKKEKPIVDNPRCIIERQNLDKCLKENFNNCRFLTEEYEQCIKNH